MASGASLGFDQFLRYQISFDDLTEPAFCEHVKDKMKALSESGTVKKLQARAGSMVAYAICKRCKVGRKIMVSHLQSTLWEVHWFQKGVHDHTAEAVAIARAKAYSHRPPVQAVAAMIHDGVSAGDVDVRESKRARRRYLERPRDSGVFGSPNTIGAWVAIMQQREARPSASLSAVDFVVRKSRWPDGEWVPLSWLGSFQQRPPSDGSCVLITKGMVETVRRFIHAGGICGKGRGVSVQDLTFKVTESGFGLGAFLWGARHIGDSGLWQTTAVISDR